MRNRSLTLTLAVAMTLLVVTAATAQDPAALAEESAAFCNSTATDELVSPDVIMGKVQEACELLEKDGTAAFPKFQGKDSPFLFAGTYMWVHTLEDGIMLMHPMKYKLNGKSIIGIKDKKGKRLFVTMNTVVKEHGDGWVEYYWPKPGSSDGVHKVSYVRGCTTADGKSVVVGCGFYKFDETTTAGLSIN